MHRYRITAKHAGQRLDKALTDKTGTTRSQIQKAIKGGLVSVNGKKPTVHQFLRLGDKIVFNTNAEMIPRKETIATAEIEKPIVEDKKTIKPKKIEPKILLQEKDYIVIEKPAGLLVHSAGSADAPTLVDWLVKKFPEIKKVGDPVAMLYAEKHFRPGIVHRLDRDVSGLIIVALTQDGFDYFKSQFKLKKIKKTYIALVSGVIVKDDDTLKFPIMRSKEGKFVALPLNSTLGKTAETEFEVLRRFRNNTLIQVHPLTGRTNQIRIHLSAISHAIVGDSVFASKKIKQKEKIKLDRIFLHATKLEFVDPEKREVSIESPLPKELSEIVERIS
ncbi:RluA family pseudouridine synthase [Patescibacteria group bacterium]|nr:RluA family pseudouridine synthase [Patescibacteria group bacterium]